jgi:cytochrome c551
MTTRFNRAAALAVISLVLGTSLSPAYALNSAGEGRRLWLKFNCYGCHGMHGAGGMGPRVAGEGEYGDVYEKVMGGADEGMPSYKKYMTKTDIKNLTTYIGTMGKKSEPTFLHWWETVPSR